MSRKINIFGSYASFDPLSYFNADLGFFLSALDIDTITKDGSNYVSSWQCQKTGYNFTTPNASEEPTYNPTGMGGYPTIDFSIGNLLMYEHSTYLYNTDSVGEIWVVKQLNNNAQNGYYLSFSRNNTTTRWSAFRNINTIQNDFPVLGLITERILGTIGVPTTNPERVVVSQNGSNGTILQNGVSDNLSIDTDKWIGYPLYAQQFTIGGLVRSTSRVYSNTDINISFVMYLRRTTTAGERTLMDNWINTNFGV